jgi:hypothetical protein
MGGAQRYPSQPGKLMRVVSLADDRSDRCKSDGFRKSSTHPTGSNNLSVVRGNATSNIITI